MLKRFERSQFGLLSPLAGSTELGCFWIATLPADIAFFLHLELESSDRLNNTLQVVPGSHQSLQTRVILQVLIMRMKVRCIMSILLILYS